MWGEFKSGGVWHVGMRGYRPKRKQMKKKTLLKDTLGDLVRANKKNYIELGRGLRVAFTPADQQENGRFRLCLSRAGNAQPSEHEANTVWAHLLKSGAVKRPFLRVVFERDAGGNWVAEWIVGEQWRLLKFDEAQKTSKGAF